MSITIDDTISTSGATRPDTIKVWDPFVRIFHWSLATLFVAAYATGEHAGQMHIAAGYTIAGLVALRIAWGFIGSSHARFSNFVKSPRAVFAYLRDTALLRAPRHIGHNPAGGAMIVALLVMLTVTSVTGYLMTTGAYGDIEEVHEVFANLTVGLVIFHVLGVLISSFAHRENLVRAMITGRKRQAQRS